MSLLLPGEPEIPAEGLPHVGVPDPHTSLERLVQLLQGSSEHSLADVGITLLPGAQLDRLSISARREAELCQERSELLLELLECCVENGGMPEPGALLRMTGQLQRLARDQRRWHDLADNASYYRDNTRVATRISSFLIAHERR
ncbi:MAG: hypothetical protein ABWZ08_00925 [Pseudoxanthomonas sp.]